MGLDKRALAKAIGVTAKQLGAFEAGKARVGPTLLDAIAQELGVGVSWFFLEPGEFG